MELNLTTRLPLQREKQLKELTTIGIGGAAKWFVTVTTVEELQEAITLCSEAELPFFILGKGSNCVFDDRGVDGVVIHNRIDFLEEISPGRMRVGAGHSFSKLGSWTARKGWGGLEFASGIPGSVGGAVYMNAGANGTETCDALESVDYIDSQGELTSYSSEQLTFSYRHSTFQKMKGAIAAATFKLSLCPEAREKQLKIIQYRTSTQPYGEKSAGCVFRNPEGDHAGSLIDRLGLKGTTHGEAAISELHGNFFINQGAATADDLRTLVSRIRDQVFEQTGIRLEPEVRFIPYHIGEP